MDESTEYVEWHLTPRGWMRGSEHTVFGGTLSFESPSDRVLTYRWVAERAPGRDYMLDRLEEQWRSSDPQEIARLLVRFGDVRCAAAGR